MAGILKAKMMIVSSQKAYKTQGIKNIFQDYRVANTKNTSRTDSESQFVESN